jgi:hypothetical protein
MGVMNSILNRFTHPGWTGLGVIFTGLSVIIGILTFIISLFEPDDTSTKAQLTLKEPSILTPLQPEIVKSKIIGKNAEMLFWQSSDKCQTVACFRAYLKKYPQGEFVGLAEARLSALAQMIVKPPVIPLHVQDEAVSKFNRSVINENIQTSEINFCKKPLSSRSNIECLFEDK